jgi:UDP-2,3-diacylglucosamine hydrolase
MPSQEEKLGLIAGNGKFPLLVLDAARAQGFEVVVAAIKEEASAEIENRGGCFGSLGFAGRAFEAD